VTPVSADGLVTVAKLNDGGSGIAWTSPVLLTVPAESPTGYYAPTIAVDAAGRTYVTGYWQTVTAGNQVVRLAANGTTIEYSTPISGRRPYSIAVDATGAAVVAGAGDSGGFVARIAPDGTPGFNVSVPDSGGQKVLLDANGNAVTDSNGTLTRLDATGHVVSSITVGPPAFSSFALDKAGNAYVMGSSRTRYYQAKNSLAPCGTEFLSVIAPDGSVLQTTYLPATAFNTVPQILIGKDGNVLMAVWPSQSFAPSRPGPLPAGQIPATSFLLSLSPTATAETFPLACLANAADYSVGSIAPGELLVLSGNGLGPQQGVQSAVSLQTPYPTKLSDVQVTFDGTPAPILWAQDSQVNVVAPWSLNTTKNTQVCMTVGSIALKCVSWPTIQTSPGVFMNYTGGKAIAMNQDGSMNSETNPAAPGTLVSVFANGLGPITPPQADGSLINLPLPTNAITATVENQGIGPGNFGVGNIGPNIAVLWTPVEVTYAGPGPYRVAGISQINFRLGGSTAVDLYRVKVPNPDGVTFQYSQQFSVYVSK
jgi:uncharacterized protein (TIGR03437 family)